MSADERRAMVRALCRQHRVQIIQVRNMFRLIGRGIDLLVPDLALVEARDIEPLP